MNTPAKVEEILSPEELAACRAYFIIVSNNVPDTGLAEPACFRIWLRLLSRAHPTLFGLAPTKPSAIIGHEKTRALPSVTPSSTTSTTTSVSPSRSPDVTPPSTVPAPDPKKSTSPAVAQHPRATLTTGQIAKQSSPVPKPATSSTANSASKPQVSSTPSITIGNIASQSAPTNVATQMAPRPGLAMRAAGTTPTVAPASGRCVHTTVAPLSHPVELPAVGQQPSIKASTPSAPSVSQPSVPMSSTSESTLKTAVQQRYPALPGLPPSLQLKLGSMYEARGESTHNVYKDFYDILYNSFVQNGGLHRLAAQLSQAPTASQTGQSGTTPQAENPNTKKRDDAHSRDHSSDEDRGRSNTSRGSNGGFNEQRSGRGQSTRPKRRKRRGDRYGDYYDGYDNYW